MFVGTGTVRKPEERNAARRLRSEEGLSIKRIAARLAVSPSSVHYWTRDIELTPEERSRNLRGPCGPHSPERVAARVEAWKRKSRDKRLGYQEEGRQRARQGDAFHQAGCMLYWAEGSKNRNTVTFANSDLRMVMFFCRFLRKSFELPADRITLRLNVYTSNGLSLRTIEDRWLTALELPRSSLRGHTLNHRPTSSSGMKTNKLPYGVGTIRVLRSTHIVQHVFGAIQEYGGFEEPRWLD